jgi:hypothetical protein
MRILSWTLVVLLLAALGWSAAARPAGDSGARTAKLAKALEGKAFSLAAAVQAAERETAGRAIGSKVEIEKGKAIVEVRILKSGEQPKLLEVEVDGETNRILGIEDDDDDDDDEGPRSRRTPLTGDSGRIAPPSGDRSVLPIGRKARDPMDLKSLTALFRKLGAPDPEGWAGSQVREGIPQLARFLFLREAWRSIVQEGNAGWIDEAIARAEMHPDEPYAGVGHALKRMRARAVTDEEITAVVRGMQARVLFNFCYLLEDPGDVEPEVADLRWAFVETDLNGNVLDVISLLHESVLETDPTGREMRPAGKQDDLR